MRFFEYLWVGLIGLTCFVSSTSAFIVAREVALEQALAQNWAEVQPRLIQGRRLGVAIMVPASGNSVPMIATLKALLGSDRSADRALMSAPLWFFIAPEDAQKIAPDLNAEHNLLLVDWDGKCLHSAAMDWGGSEIGPRLHDFVFGPNLERLTAWISALKALRSEEEQLILKQALVGLDAPRSRERRDARNALEKFLPECAPQLILTHSQSTSIEVREACADLLKIAFPNPPVVEGLQLSDDLNGQALDRMRQELFQQQDF